MRQRFVSKVLMMELAIGIALGAPSGESRAGSLTIAPVKSGYDLFQTATGSSFPGLGNLIGVPLGTYDFGSGPQDVGTVDTIIQRTQDVTVTAAGGTGQTGLGVRALQLETATQVDFMGRGLDNYFVTVHPSSTPGSPSSTGTMDITFASTDGGTFTSSLKMDVDIHKHAVNGAVVAPEVQFTLTNPGAEWVRIPPAGAELITGINHLLDGRDTNQDFWVKGLLTETHPGGGVHAVRAAAAATPEPSPWIMYLTAGLMVSACARWRRHRARRSGRG
jgi:hypothetical protein